MELKKQMEIKKTVLTILSAFVVLGLVFPMSASAQSRERQDRDTGRDNPVEENIPDDNDGEDGEDGEDGASGNNGTVHITNSIVISSHSGDQEDNGADGILTGNENSSVSVETIVNGSTVQDIEINGEDVVDDRRATRESRRHNYQNDDGDVVVDTEIEYIEDNSNDSGNNNKNGADGKDGEDGKDGADAPNSDPAEEEEEAEEEDGDRRDRGDRSGRGGIAMVWDRVSNFFSDVVRLFFV